MPRRTDDTDVNLACPWYAVEDDDTAPHDPNDPIWRAGFERGRHGGHMDAVNALMRELLSAGAEHATATAYALRILRRAQTGD